MIEAADDNVIDLWDVPLVSVRADLRDQLRRVRGWIAFTHVEDNGAA